MKNLTPQHMRCGPNNCPAVFKLDDGRLLIVGSQIQSALEETLVQTGRLSLDHEQAVIISPDLLADVEREWRTLKDAPRDGISILIATLDGRVGEAYFCQEFHQWCWAGEDVDDGGEAIGVTHWQPLPSPPKPLNEREQG